MKDDQTEKGSSNTSQCYSNSCCARQYHAVYGRRGVYRSSIIIVASCAEFAALCGIEIRASLGTQARANLRGGSSEVRAAATDCGTTCSRHNDGDPEISAALQIRNAYVVVLGTRTDCGRTLCSIIEVGLDVREREVRIRNVRHRCSRSGCRRVGRRITSTDGTGS